MCVKLHLWTQSSPNLSTKYITLGDSSMLALGNLPIEARIIATGNNLDEIRRDGHLYNEVRTLDVVTV